jgi:hypothetical protein
MAEERIPAACAALLSRIFELLISENSRFEKFTATYCRMSPLEATYSPGSAASKTVPETPSCVGIAAHRWSALLL